MPVTRKGSKAEEASASAMDSATEGTDSQTATSSGTGTTSGTETTAATGATGTTYTAADTDATARTETATAETTSKRTLKAPKPTVARSRRSGTSKKKAVWAAKEKLAELRAAEAQAEAKAAKAATELAAVSLRRAEEESSSDEEEDEEQNELSSVRITSWLQQQEQKLPQAETSKGTPEALPKEDHGVRVDRIGHRSGQANEVPTVQRSVVDLEALTTALSQIATRRDPPKYLHELPVFNGQVSAWLAYRAAYRDSEASFSKTENVIRIRKSLKGSAYEAVGSLLVSQPEPGAVMEALERRFGRPEALVLAEMEKLRLLTKVSDSARDLCVFAGRVANAVATVEALGREAYLHSPEMVRSVIEKLTPILRSKWYDYASIKKEDAPEMKKIAAFLNEEADKCGAYALPEVVAEDGQRAKKRGYEKSYSTIASKGEERCPHCEKVHKLIDCSDFIKADVSTRWAIARKHRICFLCLKEKHRRFRCQAKACAKDGCGKSHHRLLHSDTVERQPEPETRRPEVAACAAEPENSRHIHTRHAYLKIAPIELIGPKAKISTYALLDDGSTCSAS